MAKLPKDEQRMMTIVRVIAALWGLMFLLFGLFIKPAGAGGIDEQFLWDRLHPFGVGDAIGVILIVAGLIVISGVWVGKFGEQFNEPGSVRWNYVPIGLVALGSILCWL